MAHPPPPSPTAGTQQRPGGWGLWYGLSAGIVLWMVHLAGMAALTPYVCHSVETWWYHLLSVGTLLPTLAASVPCWGAWQADDGAGGTRFLGAVGLVSTGIFALAIVAEWVPVFLLDPCAS